MLFKSKAEKEENMQKKEWLSTYDLAVTELSAYYDKLPKKMVNGIKKQFNKKFIGSWDEYLGVTPSVLINAGVPNDLICAIMGQAIYERTMEAYILAAGIEKQTDDEINNVKYNNAVKELQAIANPDAPYKYFNDPMIDAKVSITIPLANLITGNFYYILEYTFLYAYNQHNATNYKPSDLIKIYAKKQPDTLNAWLKFKKGEVLTKNEQNTLFLHSAYLENLDDENLNNEDLDDKDADYTLTHDNHDKWIREHNPIEWACDLADHLWDELFVNIEYLSRHNFQGYNYDNVEHKIEYEMYQQYLKLTEEQKDHLATYVKSDRAIPACLIVEYLQLDVMSLPGEDLKDYKTLLECWRNFDLSTIDGNWWFRNY